MKLKIGDRIQGKLVEEMEDNLWIVSIDGDLLQVRNTSDLSFKEGKKVQLQVMREKPLQLIILGQAQRSVRGFNIRV